MSKRARLLIDVLRGVVAYSNQTAAHVVLIHMCVDLGTVGLYLLSSERQR